MTETATPGPVTTSRVRALRLPLVVLGGAVAAVGWLRHTGGYDVLPGGLATCPLHASTGLWCPFCGGLRCVAALSRGDLAAAASFNLAVLVLLPAVTLWWGLTLRAAWRGEPGAAPHVTNRGWMWVGAALLAFMVWRNLPGLPLGSWLAP